MTLSKEHPPFGTYALSPLRDALRLKSGLWRQSVRIVGSTLRHLSMIGQREPFDVETKRGNRVRLYPSQNVSDKKCFMGLGVLDQAENRFMALAVADTPDGRFKVVDVGANSGMYAILAANAAQDACKDLDLVCIEANPEMHRRLAFNLEASGVANAELFNCAVSDHEGIVHLSLDNWNLGQATIVENGKGRKVVAVPSRPLADIIGASGLDRIDFLKIDVEGHEVPALKPYLEAGGVRPLPHYIFAEVSHDPEDAIETLLLAHGYVVHERMEGDTLFKHQGAS